MSTVDPAEARKILKLKKGKGFYVTEDNIAAAQAARQANRRIKAGTASPADFDLVNGRNEMTRQVYEAVSSEEG
jgi:hypothetical protein